MDFLSKLFAPVQNEVKQLPQQVGNFGQNLVHSIAQPVQSYFTPTSNNGNNFWSSPVASILAGHTQLPQVNLTPLANNIQNPVYKFGAQLGLGTANSLINTPANLLQAPINIARDVNTGVKRPQQYLADAAPFAEGMLNIGTLGGGTVAKGIAEQGIKQGLKQGIKEGAVQGAKYGGAYGLLNGLQSGANINNPLQYAGNIAKNTGIGAVGGAALGAGTGALTGLPRSIVTKTISKLFPDNSPKQVAQKTDQYLQRTFTRNGVGQFAKSEATPFIPAGRAYATPKNPLKVTHWMDRVDQEIKSNIPQPGLSIKAVNSKQLLASEGKVTKEGIKSINIPTQVALKNRAEVNAGNPDLYTQRTAKLQKSGIPTSQEQSSINAFDNLLKEPTIGKSPTLLENPPKNVPPEKPSYSAGQASNNPKLVAESGRLASFAARQSLQVRGSNLAQEMNSVIKTPKDNLNIRLAIENPSKIDQYASKASDPNGFADVAKKIIDYHSYALQSAKGEKVQMGVRQNYFPHIWDLSTPAKQKVYDDLLAANANNFKSARTQVRKIPTIAEGLAAGLELKNPKAASDITDYAKSMGTQISNAAFNNKINELRPNGAVAFKDNGTVPYNHEGKLFQQSNKPGNQGTFIDPEIQKHLDYYNKSGLADNKIINFADKVNSAIKEVKLSGGLFHAMRESVNYAGQQLASGHLPDLAGGARAFVDPQWMRGQMDNFIANGTLDKASKMGVDISNAGGIGDDKLNVLDLLNSRDPIKKATFQRLIPYYILKTVQNLPDKAQTPAVGEQIQALYSGLNQEVAGVNKTVAQVGRLTALAPQFNLGKLINVAKAITPSNSPQANFARSALFGTAIATAIEYQAVNYAVNHKFDTNLVSILQNGVLQPNVSLPYKSPTGKGLTADLPGSDVADLYKSGIGSLVEGKPAQAATDFGHFITSRGAALPSIVNQLTTGKDYYGNPLDAGNLVQSQLPIPAVQILKTLQNNPKTGQPSQNATTAALNTIGLRVHNDPNDPVVQAQTQYFNGLNATANGLNANDKQMFLSMLHPTTKDANGNSIVDKNMLSTPDKYETLLAHPSLLAAEQKFQQSQPNHDPLWDWTPAQRQAYMQAQVISKNDPGGDKTTTKQLYALIPQQQLDQRSQWASALPQSTTGTQLPQAPQTPPEISNFWNQYQTLPKGTGARTRALQTPIGQQALNLLQQQQQFTNSQRADLGLPLLASTTSSSGYGTRAKKISFPKIKGNVKSFKVPAVKIKTYNPKLPKLSANSKRPPIVKFSLNPKVSHKKALLA